MQSFKIITDTSCDLSTENLGRLDIDFVPFSVSLDGVNYKKEKLELDADNFYHTLSTENVFPKTSLPSMQDFFDTFYKAYKSGHNQILAICLSSDLSGSYQSAVNAQKLFDEEHPDCKIEVVDSLNATGGQGLLVLEATKMRDAGLDLSQTFQKIEKLKLDSKTAFTVDSLDFLKKGGRISNVAAFAGELLNIKPIVKMENGKLIPGAKVRGKKKAMSEIVDFIVTETKGNKDDYILGAMFASALAKEDALAMQQVLEKEHGYTFNSDFFQVGVTIGAHVGPTAIGISYLRKYS